MDAIRCPDIATRYPYRWRNEKIFGVLPCGCDKTVEPLPLVVQCIVRIWRRDPLSAMKSLVAINNRQIAEFVLEWFWVARTYDRLAVLQGQSRWNETDAHALEPGMLAHEKPCNDHGRKRQRT